MPNTPSFDELLKAGCHYGHLKRKWNPYMRPHIFMEKNGIHVIDLNSTIRHMEKAGQILNGIAQSGRKILYVATKKQARQKVSDSALSVGMPFVTERWLGGIMTNFATVKRSVKKMNNIDKMLSDGSLSSVTKKERLTLTRERDKLERILGGVAKLSRTPAAMFIVDITQEHIALKEAKKLGMTTVAIVDTNSNPELVDFPIPANDDAVNSIGIITDYLTDCVKEGLKEREKKKEELQTEAAAE